MDTMQTATGKALSTITIQTDAEQGNSETSGDKQFKPNGRFYERQGIPPKWAYMNFDSLSFDGDRAKLWDKFGEHSAPMLEANIPERGLFLHGSQGAGKSTFIWMLARAALTGFYKQPTNARLNDYNELVTEPHPFLITKFTRLIKQVPPKEGQNFWNHELADEVTKYKRLLFIDDMTFDPQAGSYQWARDFVFSMIDNLSDRQPGTFALYITTNNSAAQLEELIGGQTVDRITGMCDPIKCNWKSLRRS